ncbi:MAG TPA: BPL-N domain-containing protein [Micromonospora sp.]|nr:BPL-N domain-containing protein [Micromonospora sp.]
MRLSRRKLLIGAGAAGAVGGLGWAGAYAFKDRPLALVYRGPASCSGCSESVANLLAGMPIGFRTEFCGPDEARQISAGALAGAVVYAQPGGGSIGRAWRSLRDHADDIRAFVRDGGNYLGFCLGGYLAGPGRGFGLLSAEVDSYISSPRASVHDTADTLVQIRWRGELRSMYFQDGPVFRLRPGASATVLATYDTGEPAAVVAGYGAGRVGVVGPHPEADELWYADVGLTNPEGIRQDLGHDLIESTVYGRDSVQGN